jgi:hypothetical protein
VDSPKKKKTGRGLLNKRRAMLALANGVQLGLWFFELSDTHFGFKLVHGTTPELQWPPS